MGLSGAFNQCIFSLSTPLLPCPHYFPINLTALCGCNVFVAVVRRVVGMEGGCEALLWVQMRWRGGGVRVTEAVVILSNITP